MQKPATITVKGFGDLTLDEIEVELNKAKSLRNSAISDVGYYTVCLDASKKKATDACDIVNRLTKAQYELQEYINHEFGSTD